ncbi:uncharacterized protein LOC128984748 [Macrosteles quadrilineatus]|uniref:uncharacterized protein LOC128984748 n=1 Tax=Macrosteles quadrilineatus TaxID=74068 RepID=UPI0023E22BD3|nr:uncharacterized protein LOC128984748 [Macrosteles quadrilineatus]
MYGLPKIHKPNVPLRPIVSSRDSACRELSKVLLDILKPLVGNTDSFIKNSKDFVEKSKSIVLADTDKLVSFDVERIESAVSQLPESQGDQFRCEASILLKKIPTPKPNLSKEETKAVSVLGKDGTVKILPADKGNATVVLDTVTYEEKMLETLQSGQYTQLKKDPTETFERKIASTLRKHKKFFSDKQRTRLTPHHSKIPHMYGLPKIHKPNVPLRPIVSSRDSACRELSKVLLDILKPLVGNTDSFIKNSKDFVEKSKSIVLADTDKLVSFDVESLFTNVPVSETLKIIETRLTNDDTLANRTKLPVNVIMELLELCTQCNYFQLEGKLYRQDEGMAMGSPLSPIFANIFMEEFEQKALASARLKPRICLWNAAFFRKRCGFFFTLSVDSRIKSAIMEWLEPSNHSKLP